MAPPRKKKKTSFIPGKLKWKDEDASESDDASMVDNQDPEKETNVQTMKPKEIAAYKRYFANPTNLINYYKKQVRDSNPFFPALAAIGMVKDDADRVTELYGVKYRWVVVVDAEGMPEKAFLPLRQDAAEEVSNVFAAASGEGEGVAQGGVEPLSGADASAGASDGSSVSSASCSAPVAGSTASSGKAKVKAKAKVRFCRAFVCVVLSLFS